LTKIQVDPKGGLILKVLSLSEAKMKLSELVERVSSTDEEVIITKNGRPSAVLVSPDEYAGWKETIEIKRDPELMAEIRAGLSDLKKGRIYTLEDLL